MSRVLEAGMVQVYFSLSNTCPDPPSQRSTANSVACHKDKAKTGPWFTNSWTSQLLFDYRIQLFLPPCLFKEKEEESKGKVWLFKNPVT